MRNRYWLGLWAAAWTVASIGITASAAAQITTVGDFVQKVATAKRLPAQDAIIAEASLRAAGFQLPPVNQGARLTEGAVAAISTAMGLRITTGTPAASFEEKRLERFMTAMSSRLESVPGSGGAVRSASSESSGSGKGKKKPHSKSPKRPKPPKPPHTGHR